MTTTPAAARLARIAATLKTHEAAVAFTQQERETLRDLCGFAALNGGRSPELQAQVDAFKDFCRTCPALQVDTLA